MAHIHYQQCSDRIIWVRILKSQKKHLLFKSTYIVYKEIKGVLTGVKGTGNLILMGDWNAVVAKGKEGDIAGRYGLGERNKRGDR